jgi:hypothetical protein
LEAAVIPAKAGSPQTPHFLRFAEWIPAFAGMTATCNDCASQFTPVSQNRRITKMKRVTVKWFKYLIAIVLGNGLYFALNPYLPQAARHHTYKLDLGTLVDFWLCLAVFGVLELGAFLHNQGRR